MKTKLLIFIINFISLPLFAEFKDEVLAKYELVIESKIKDRTETEIQNEYNFTLKELFDPIKTYRESYMLKMLS